MLWYRDLDHLSDEDYAREAETRLTTRFFSNAEEKAMKAAEQATKCSFERQREALARVVAEPENCEDYSISALYELGLIRWKTVSFQTGNVTFTTRRGPYELTPRGQKVLDGNPSMATVVSVSASDAEILDAFRPHFSRSLPEDLKHIRSEIASALAMIDLMEPFQTWRKTKVFEGIHSSVKIKKVPFSPSDVFGGDKSRYVFTKLVFTDDDLFVEFRLKFSNYQLECHEMELSDVE